MGFHVAVMFIDSFMDDVAYKFGRFIMFSVITNIYNKKTKGPTLMELFTVLATHADACVATT